MNVIALIVGTLIAALIIEKFGTAHSIRSIKQYIVLLATFPFYYFVFAIAASDFNALYYEIYLSIGFLLVAYLAYKVKNAAALVVLAMGYIFHAIYDVIHEELFINSGTPTWWPEFCGAVDVIVGIYLLYIVYLSLTNKRHAVNY